MTVQFKAANNIGQMSSICHGFFTRAGGVSDGIYASLNCGFGSEDLYDNVLKNRTRVAEAMGATFKDLCTPFQIHSSSALIVNEPWLPDQALEADALITNKKGLRIAVLTADCGPVLFADGKAGVIAAAHAGWKGAISGILEETISKMELLGAQKNNMYAAIGPAISQSAYEVGHEFKENFIKTSPENDKFFKQFQNARPHFDLTAYIANRLKVFGLEKVENLNICTVTNESEFFSYRRSVHRKEPDYGRQISVIGLR